MTIDTAPQAHTIAEGDLVEITTPIPNGEPRFGVGTRFIVGTTPAPMDEHDAAAYPEFTGPVFEPEDPKGRWFGADIVPISHVKLIQKAADQLLDPKELAQAVAHGVMAGLDDDVLRVIETGVQSEDGQTMYVIGSTPEGIRVSFLIRVGEIERAE